MVVSCKILSAIIKTSEKIWVNVDTLNTYFITHLDKLKHSETGGICNSLVKSYMGGGVKVKLVNKKRPKL